MFTYSNGYWEVYRRFQGDFFGLGGDLRGEGYMGGYFHGETSHGGSEFQLRWRKIFEHYLKKQ